MRFRWSRDASRDRDSIFDYIAGDSFSAAVSNDQRIAALEGQLTTFPDSGRKGRIHGTREWIIADTPFLAIYRIDNDGISVLRVIHGAQRWPPADRV